MLKKSSKDELAFLNDLQNKCINYFSFDPEGSLNDVSMEECLENGDLPPGGVKENFSMYSVYYRDKIIGYFDTYRGFPKEDIAYISIFFLDEDNRKQGFGKEIVEELCKYFKSIGFIKVRLGVSLRNWTGLSFWFKNGFCKITNVRCDGNCTDENYGVVELEIEL